MGPLGYKIYLHEGTPKGVSLSHSWSGDMLFGHMCLGYSPLPHLYSANVLVMLLLANKRVETFVECFFGVNSKLVHSLQKYLVYVFDACHGYKLKNQRMNAHE